MSNAPSNLSEYGGDRYDPLLECQRDVLHGEVTNLFEYRSQICHGKVHFKLTAFYHLFEPCDVIFRKIACRHPQLCWSENAIIGPES